MSTLQSTLYCNQYSPVFVSRLEAEYRSTRNAHIRMRRRQEVKKHILLLVVSILLVCSLSLFMNKSFTKASTPNSETYKYYKSIQLAYGDTLWTIANEYMDANYDSVTEYINEVKFMNCLTEDTIQAGSYLIIPYYSSEFKE